MMLAFCMKMKKNILYQYCQPLHLPLFQDESAVRVEMGVGMMAMLNRRQFHRHQIDRTVPNSGFGGKLIGKGPNLLR